VEPFATALGLAAAGVLLVVATLLSPLSHRLGIPVLLAILGVGMLAGSEGIGGIPFEDYRLAFRVGTVALVLILFDGGLGTPIAPFRRALPRAAVLATFGVLLTAAGVAGAAIALGFPPALALLVGAVVSSTDAAAVFSVLRSSGVRLKETTSAVLEVESGLNDPVAMLLTSSRPGWSSGRRIPARTRSRSPHGSSGSASCSAWGSASRGAPSCVWSCSPRPGSTPC
jgi:cell volume regulation protein A